MGIKLGMNFTLRNQTPVDDRQEFKTILEMKEFPETSLYNGIITTNKEDNNTYQFKFSNEVDETTGKWRLLSSGTGTKGDDGKSAYDLWIDAGNSGTEADFLESLKGEGTKGDDGKSAYDLWIDAGNTGTEADFLESLKGDGADVNIDELKDTFASKESEHTHGNLESLEIITSDDIKKWNEGSVAPVPDGITIKIVDGKWQAEGLAPSIGENGNWYIGDTDTGIKVQDSTGRIRLQSDSALVYLNEILDKGSFIIDGNMIKVKSIDGMTTSIAELNFIKGLDRNITEIIDLMGTAMKPPKSAVTNDAALSAIANPKAGDTYIVESSESKEGKTAVYCYTELGGWICIGITEISIRNFETDPIDLKSEITGVLSKEHISGYHVHDNIGTLNGLKEIDGKLYFNDSPVASESSGSGSGSGGVSNYMDLEDKPTLNGVVIAGDKTASQYGLDTLFLTVDKYASTENSGYVKGADKAIDLATFDERNQPYMYYGTDKDNKVGKHIMPINGTDSSVIQQRIFENVVAGDQVSFESLTDLNNKAIINLYKETPGLKNIDTNIKSYNSSSSNSFYNSNDITFADDKCYISNKIKLESELDEVNGFYKISLKDFKEINEIRNEVDE